MFLTYHPHPPCSPWLAFKSRGFEKVWKTLLHVNEPHANQTCLPLRQLLAAGDATNVHLFLQSTATPWARSFYKITLRGWTGAASSPAARDAPAASLHLLSEDEPPLRGTEGVTSCVMDLEACHFLPTKSSSWVV